MWVYVARCYQCVVYKVGPSVVCVVRGGGSGSPLLQLTKQMCCMRFNALRLNRHVRWKRVAAQITGLLSLAQVAIVVWIHLG